MACLKSLKSPHKEGMNLKPFSDLQNNKEHVSFQLGIFLGIWGLKHSLKTFN